MATIKPIEAHSIHQIQSGQVIVDLCSVVKELVENSLDADATSLEVRFKNNGLDSIEVQDNGSGISPSNYESLALKHYTSKLASYDDLSSLRTFGFRGEALSSLCALSTFYVVTAMADEAPKGKKLDFESSGKLKDTTVVAAQKGTTAVVETLFEQLPVRRKELLKNIKKEYGKVLGLLHAYACVCTNVKFTVKSAMPKGKNATVFATKANPTTRENIANVYGAKTLSALVPLQLQLDFQRTEYQKKDADDSVNKIIVKGHISRPVFGEGRQTPDRQMFFVNGRPCGLPQIAKAFNEVYKSFNVSQSPFIFADLEMDTNSYDVNVSPDKRTIMLHDSAALVETLKSSLTQLFDQQEQTVPQSHVPTSRLPSYKQLSITRESTLNSADSDRLDEASASARKSSGRDEDNRGTTFMHDFFTNQASTREEPKLEVVSASNSRHKKNLAKSLEAKGSNTQSIDEYDDAADSRDVDSLSDREHVEEATAIRIRDFNQRIAEQQSRPTHEQLASDVATEQADMLSATALVHPPQSNAVQNAFDRIRPPRPTAELATITVGNKTVTTMVGSQARHSNSERTATSAKNIKISSVSPASSHAFTQRLRGFTAAGIPGVQTEAGNSDEEPSDESQEVSPDTGTLITGNLSQAASAEERHDGETDDSAGTDGAGPVAIAEDDTDGEYIDEIEKKAQEDAVVAKLIRAAEEKATSLNASNTRRVNRAFRIGSQKDSTTSFQLTIATSIEKFKELTRCWHSIWKDTPRQQHDKDCASGGGNEEDRLALSVSKIDFSNMHIVGQFNLGFILAVRTASAAVVCESNNGKADELFIVDQHASDEKYNFERLQAETVVGNQRLVRPKQLDLTAVEEEILVENSLALEKNGFLVEIASVENEPIGQRCKLISLPLSKEMTFGLEDLEELLHLLTDSAGLSHSSIVPRPSKVRKMFAMRACRSSIMIGKPLTVSRMKAVISHMGEIDKPWNCPHGRPTMRHLMTLNTFETWQEGDGTVGRRGEGGGRDLWSRFVEAELRSN